jgi:hypothetical protein
VAAADVGCDFCFVKVDAVLASLIMQVRQLHMLAVTSVLSKLILCLVAVECLAVIDCWFFILVF